ncbi:hypothetical protein [Micromonospora sp. NBC_01796]|uniref:hypothetical protein n=1 Tax=Micromonospora sp. NBC_01796 TaxID=2975987 RepID=UPI002DD9CE58|nr:hypothetical protein [Micromonospora sp. NBC_01796]WSA89257.1 hypothetical protein OIE47_17570 [Micromonospora sp. NBC_01796]
MAGAPDLGKQARKFAETLSELLNRTVCDNAKVVAVLHANEEVVVGTLLNRQELLSEPVRMRSRARFSRIWLDLSCRLFLNEEGYLTVRTSYCGIYLGPEHEHTLLHYDYERDKEIYTEAHVQVDARHESLEQLLRELGLRDRLRKLHLPVGGRRF